MVVGQVSRAGHQVLAVSPSPHVAFLQSDVFYTQFMSCYSVISFTFPLAYVVFSLLPGYQGIQSQVCSPSRAPREPTLFSCIKSHFFLIVFDPCWAVYLKSFSKECWVIMTHSFHVRSPVGLGSELKGASSTCYLMFVNRLIHCRNRSCGLKGSKSSVLNLVQEECGASLACYGLGGNENSRALATGCPCVVSCQEELVPSGLGPLTMAVQAQSPYTFAVP